MHTLTEEQIAQLAPDAASLKAGKELANEKKWLSHAYNERVMWGEIKGSGSSPYRTQIDIQQTAFKCSCPSRKFPCKHGLGLFLLSAKQPGLFTQSADEPAWVKEWMDKRNEKVAKKPVVADEPAEAKKSDKQAKDREKRQNERLLKVQAGIAELELWLKDLVRTGLLTAPEKGHAFWDKMAARMVDAQAAGLGNMVRELGAIAYFSGNEWQETLVQQIAKIYLLIEAFKNIDSLPPLLQEDVRNLIGWNKSQKELLDSTDIETIRDTWLGLSRQTDMQDDLTIQRNWLYGTRSKRYALILNFAYRNAPIPNLLIPGTFMEAELAFYPSVYPMRAVVKYQGPTKKQSGQPDLFSHWETAQDQYAAALSAMPWVDRVPMSISGLTLTKQASCWLLADQNNQCMTIDARFDEQQIFQLLAYSGGKPLDLFLLRSQTTIMPLGTWYEGKYRVL